MMIGVELTYLLLTQFLPVERKLYALIILLVCVLIGAMIYGFATIKTKLADEFLGDVAQKVRNRIGFLR